MSYIKCFSRFVNTSGSCEGPSFEREFELESCGLENEISLPKNLVQKFWKLNVNTLNLSQCRTKYNKKIQIEKVPSQKRKQVNNFFICEMCGRVTWENSEAEKRFHHTIKDIVVMVEAQ